MKMSALLTQLLTDTSSVVCLCACIGLVYHTHEAHAVSDKAKSLYVRKNGGSLS